MSILNEFKEQLRKDPPPAEFTVTQRQVGPLVEEIYQASHPNVGLGRLPRETTRRQLLDGRIKCFGIPVRVVGVKRRKSENG